MKGFAKTDGPQCSIRASHGLKLYGKKCIWNLDIVIGPLYSHDPGPIHSLVGSEILDWHLINHTEGQHTRPVSEMIVWELLLHNTCQSLLRGFIEALYSFRAALLNHMRTCILLRFWTADGKLKKVCSSRVCGSSDAQVDLFWVFWPLSLPEAPIPFLAPFSEHRLWLLHTATPIPLLAVSSQPSASEERPFFQAPLGTVQSPAPFPRSISGPQEMLTALAWQFLKVVHF